MEPGTLGVRTEYTHVHIQTFKLGSILGRKPQNPEQTTVTWKEHMGQQSYKGETNIFAV